MAYEYHAFTIRDGKITLYTRNLKNNSVWQCRFMAKGKCIRRTTKETQIEAATRKAGEIYDETNFKIKHDMPIGITTFEVVWKEWLQIQQSRLTKDRISYIRSIERTYFIPYFGKKPISSIDTATVTNYWAWREANAAKVKPAPKSLAMEAQLLGQFLRWATDTNRLPKTPIIKSPLKVKPKDTRRPAFTKPEYEKLVKFMHNWIRSTDPRIAKRRRLFRNFVMIMFASGMRANEARNLRWRDVELDDYVLLTVSGKTGSRVLVAQPEARSYLIDQRKVSDYTKPDDYVFANHEGDKTRKFDETFERLVKAAGVWEGNDGKKKVVYSMRHTYCTFRLLYGKVDVFKLANNMGTSVEMINKHYGHILNQNVAAELVKTNKKGKGLTAHIVNKEPLV